MNLLLDTHIFLRYISGDIKLSPRHRNAIQDPANVVFLSVASIWEAVIKHAVGRLPLPEPPASYLPRQRIAHQIASLPIEEPALERLANLPALHRDPFDRLLVAQAQHYGLTLVSVDPFVKSYAVSILPEV
jgi:PIN domain nuclease of toxin-antitoxin system